MATGPLKVEITGDVKGLTDALERGTSGIKGFAKDTEAMTKGLGNVIGNLKAPFIALAAIFGGGAFLKSTVTETKEWTVEAQKLSRVLGITTEQASILNLAVGDIYGTSEEYLGAVAKLTKTLNANEQAFKQLGVATRDSNGDLRSTPDIMTDVNTALMAMKSGTDRNIESARIYGKSWVEVQRYLKLTDEVMQAAKEKAEKLNLIVGQDSVTATNQYRASMNDLEDTVKALKIRIGNELMPVLTTLNNDLAETGPGAVSAIGTAFQWFYGIILGLREEIETFGSEIKYLWKGMELGAMAAGLQLKALLTGQFKEASEIATAYAAGQRDLALAAAQEINGIQDKYTDMAMSLWGLGPKKSATDPAEADRLAREAEEKAAAAKRAADKKAAEEEKARLEAIQLEVRFASEMENIKAGEEKFNEETRKEGLRKWKEQQKDLLEAEQKLAKDIQAAWEQNTTQGGIFSYLQEAKQALQQWGTFAKTILQGVEMSFAHGIQGMLSGQMKLSQGLKSIWKGIGDTVASALAQMAAKWIVAAIASKLFSKASQQGAQEEAIGKQQAAAAGIFNAHAYIPFVGPAIAAGLIAMMNATLLANTVAAKGVVANAQGSLVTSPTLALIGERGENEVVAPETVFQDWAGNLTRNIMAQERQVQAHQLQGAGYASAARETGSFGGSGYVDLRGAVIAGESAESARIIGKLIRKHGQGNDQRNG